MTTCGNKLERNNFPFWILVIAFFLKAQFLSASVFTSKFSGPLSTPSTWDLPQVLTNMDTIIVVSGFTVTITSPIELSGVIIQSGGVLDNQSSLTFPDNGYGYHWLVVDGEYKGFGATIINYNTYASGLGIISTTSDWLLNRKLDILSGSNLTVENSYFNISNGALNNFGTIVFNAGSISLSTTLANYNYGVMTLTIGSITGVGGVFNYGELTVGGNVSTTGGTSGYKQFRNYSNAILNIKGSLLPSNTPLYNYIGSTINYNGTNQTIKRSTAATGAGGLPADTYYNLKCSNKGVKILGYPVTLNSLTIKGNLTIRDSAVLDVRSTKLYPADTIDNDITLQGNWYDSSVVTDPFVERTGTVTFSGDSAQGITSSPVSGGETFYNLIINNSDTGIVLNNNININNTLTLNDGLIHTGADTVGVTKVDSSAITAYSDTSYVDGFLKRNISPTTDSSYDFPIGNATSQALANIKFFGSNTVGSITANFSNPSNGSGLSLTDDNDAQYDALLNCGGINPGTGNANSGVWKISSSNGPAIYDLSLYGRHFDNQGTMYHSIVKRSSSLVPWEFAGTYLAAELKTDTLIARRTCLTDFYEFAIVGSNTTKALNTNHLSFYSPDSMVCGGKCIALSGKGLDSPTSWRWTLSGGTFANLNDTSLQNPSGICFNNVGNYDVRLIASNACQQADTLAIANYIKVKPIPSISITGDVSICSGKRTVLSEASLIPNLSYLWSTGSTSQSINVIPLTSTTYSLLVSTAFCQNSDSIEVKVTTNPTASLTASTTAICSGENVLITSGTTADNYFWSNGESSNIITVSPETTQTYTLTLSNSNCSDQGMVTINVTTQPTATITGETSICSGKRLVLSAKSDVPGVSYLWNTGATNEGINASSPVNTTYSVVLSNGTCKDTASTGVRVGATPTITLTANKTIVCAGDSVKLSATGTGDYLWSTGNSTGTITVSPQLPVRYSLKLSNGSCFDADSLFINVVPIPTASISGSATICSGNSLSMSAGGGEVYLWNSGETTASITKTPLSNTSYSVTVSNGGGLCIDTANRSIALITPVPADAGPDLTIAIGLDTVLTANNGSAWNWYPKVRMDCSTCQSPIVAPFQTTSYTVTVTDINGCLSSDSVIVYVIPCAKLFIPEAFSPNNDGQNDVLYIRGTDCIDKINAFTIFNRWGEKVFETTDIKTGWDGSQSKETLPNEVFIYYLDALSINGDAVSKTGNVTLMR